MHTYYRISVAFIIFCAAFSTEIPASGPEQCGFSFALKLGPGFHFSTAADMEKEFIRTNGVYFNGVDPSGARDSQPLNISHYDIGSEILATYNFSSPLGCGLLYHFGITRQRSDQDYWRHTEDLLYLQRMCGLIQYSPEIPGNVGLLVTIPVGYAFGNLYRLPLIYEYLTDTKGNKEFINEVHQPVFCNGGAIGLNIDLIYSLGDYWFFQIGGMYNYSSLHLQNNTPNIYPKSISVNEISLRVGIGVMTLRKY